VAARTGASSWSRHDPAGALRASMASIRMRALSELWCAASNTADCTCRHRRHRRRRRPGPKADAPAPAQASWWFSCRFRTKASYGHASTSPKLSTPAAAHNTAREHRVERQHNFSSHAARQHTVRRPHPEHQGQCSQSQQGAAGSQDDCTLFRGGEFPHHALATRRGAQTLAVRCSAWRAGSLFCHPAAGSPAQTHKRTCASRGVQRRATSILSKVVSRSTSSTWRASAMPSDARGRRLCAMMLATMVPAPPESNGWRPGGRYGTHAYFIN
jgi:hypothetical protein